MLGVAAAVVSLVGGVWLNRTFGDGAVDGEFVLVEPGIFEEPLDEVNDDASGTPLPDVDLEDADGRVVSLADYGGAPMVINVWFSNCAPCRRELSDFAVVHDEVGDGVQFVGIDPFDTPDAMERFADERGVTYDLLRDPERSFSNEIGIVAYPVTLFVDADGRIVRQTGEIDAAELRSAIDELF